MSIGLDEILKDEPAREPEAEAPAEAKADERPRDESGKFVAKEKGAEAESSAKPEKAPAETPVEEAAPDTSTGETVAPPATKDEPKTVPLTALEDERRKRREATERLARLEAELASVKNPRPDDLEDPDGAKTWDQQSRINERINLSYEMALETIPDFEEVMQGWGALQASDPSVYEAAARAKNPAKYAYDAVKRHQVLQEVGTDPAAYRARVEAEIRQAMEAERAQSQQADQKAQVRESLPTSLAGQRSVTSRNTGPERPVHTPLEKLLSG